MMREALLLFAVGTAFRAIWSYFHLAFVHPDEGYYIWWAKNPDIPIFPPSRPFFAPFEVVLLKLAFFVPGARENIVLTARALGVLISTAVSAVLFAVASKLSPPSKSTKLALALFFAVPHVPFFEWTEILRGYPMQILTISSILLLSLSESKAVRSWLGGFLVGFGTYLNLPLILFALVLKKVSFVPFFISFIIGVSPLLFYNACNLNKIPSDILPVSIPTLEDIFARFEGYREGWFWKECVGTKIRELDLKQRINSLLVYANLFPPQDTHIFALWFAKVFLLSTLYFSFFASLIFCTQKLKNFKFFNFLCEKFVVPMNERERYFFVSLLAVVLTTVLLAPNDRVMSVTLPALLLFVAKGFSAVRARKVAVLCMLVIVITNATLNFADRRDCSDHTIPSRDGKGLFQAKSFACVRSDRELLELVSRMKMAGVRFIRTTWEIAPVINSYNLGVIASSTGWISFDWMPRATELVEKAPQSKVGYLWDASRGKELAKVISARKIFETENFVGLIPLEDISRFIYIPPCLAEASRKFLWTFGQCLRELMKACTRKR